MHYLPPQPRSWEKGWLHVPDTWKGGKRKVAIQVDYSQSRVIDGVIHFWIKITSRDDPHLKATTTAFMSENLITGRK